MVSSSGGIEFGNTLRTAIFPTRPAFLCGAVRVRGSEGGKLEIRVRIDSGVKFYE